MSVICPRCKTRSLHLPASTGAVRCVCKPRDIHFRKLPAYDRSFEPAEAERAVLEEESTCMNHPDRKALHICEKCGKFICGMCHTEHGDLNLCLNCFTLVLKEELPMESLGSGAKSTRYDYIAFALALLPVITVWLTLFTAPMALFMVIRHWKDHPYSVIPHGRGYMIWAAILSLLQIGGWVTFFLIVYSES